jgi:Family of unknown function (DUF6194)
MHDLRSRHDEFAGRTRSGRDCHLDQRHVSRHRRRRGDGATFFSLDASQWPNFATIVTTDEHDMGEPSRLSRDGVFRLNIAVGRATFERLAGRLGDSDYAALDRFIPHPVYAKQRWIAILNPSRTTFDEQVKPLIAEAHEPLAAPKRRRNAGVD